MGSLDLVSLRSCSPVCACISTTPTQRWRSWHAGHFRRLVAQARGSPATALYRASPPATASLLQHGCSSSASPPSVDIPQRGIDKNGRTWHHSGRRAALHHSIDGAPRRRPAHRTAPAETRRRRWPSAAAAPRPTAAAPRPASAVALAARGSVEAPQWLCAISGNNNTATPTPLFHVHVHGGGGAL